jgi:hypothetical protein
LYYKNKGQTSIEVLVILAVSLIVLIFIIQTSQKSLNNYESMILEKKTDSFLNELVLASNLVYQQGYGAKTRVFLDIPENLNYINISNKTISVEFINGNSKYRNLNFEVAGNLPVNEGSFYADVEVGVSGSVYISKNNSDFIPECGNNIAEIGEQCDGSDLRGQTCNSLFGFIGGNLACNTNCRFDTSNCIGQGVDYCNDCSIDGCSGKFNPNKGLFCCDDKGDCPGDENCIDSCINNECINKPLLTLCNTTYKCSNSGYGGYLLNGNIPSQGYCNGVGHCNYAKSSPVCSINEGEEFEGYEYNMCINGYANCVETCNDWIDNDGDGLVDCLDPKCQNFIYSGGELPNYGIDESLSKDNGINMTGNLLLFHLNDLTSNVIDYSGNGFNGVTNAEYVDGKIGKSLNFNANNHRLRVENFNLLNGKNQVTIAGWVKQNSLSQSQYLLWADDNVLIEFGASYDSPQGPSNLRIRWNLNGDWRNSHIVPDILETNVWNHWVIVFDNGVTKIYKNSELFYTGSDSQTTFSTNGNIFDFGIRPTNQRLNGLIDEIAIWNRPLSQNEINNIYNLQSRCDIYCPTMMCFAEGLWKHSIPIHIKTLTGIAPQNYQVLVSIDSNIVDNFNWSLNCNDIRFFDENKKVVNYWVEECDVINEKLKVWLKINEEIDELGTTVTMYYDNSFALSESNVSNVFIADNIFLVTGRCPSSNVGCTNFANHFEADYIKANIGINSYDIDDFGYVERIDHNENIFGDDNYYYSRYRFLFVPKQTKQYNILTNSDDGSEVAIFPGDGYGGGIRTIHPYGQHNVIANWYNRHAALSGCASNGNVGSVVLEENKGYWFDYMQHEYTGSQLSRLCINDGTGYKTLDISNFLNQIYTRQYITPEPIVEIDYELAPQEPFEEVIEQWNYYVPLIINAPVGFIPNNYQILIHLNDTSFNYTYNWNNECNDFRFITLNNIELDYYIEECNVENNESYVWIKTNNEINDFETTINLYYGNINAISKSSVNNVFIKDKIFLITGRCNNGEIGCHYLTSHEQANYIRSNVGLNPYDIDGYDYVDSINHNENIFGSNDRYYSRYRFMFIPQTSGTYLFGTNSDDGSEVIYFPKDGYGGGIRTTMPYGENELLAYWYGGHGAGTCGVSGTQYTKELQANKAYWFDYLQEEALGSQLSQMCINDGYINKIISTINFPGQIYARSYITPEPIIAFGNFQYIGPELEIEYPIGGEIYNFEDYIIHSFTNIGENSFIVPDGFSVDVEYLIVAGGGGGGRGGQSAGGGGGAGGLLTNIELNSLSLSSGEYSVIVGNGGLPESNGENSSFADLVAIGGGNGGKWNDGVISGGNGGSGGGAGSRTNLGYGSGIENQGYNGGDNSGTQQNSFAGGGGGAGSIGGSGTTIPGNGGIGRYFGSYFGTNIGENGWFSGGGGAGIRSNNDGKLDNGGLGGGGSGFGSNSDNAEDGIINTGGGGGGAGSIGGNPIGGSGGSGIVLIRYKETDINFV